MENKMLCDEDYYKLGKEYTNILEQAKVDYEKKFDSVNTPATVVAVFEQFNLDTKYIPLLHLLAYQTKRYCSEALMNDRNLCNNPLFDTSFRKDFMNHFILQNADLIKTDDFNIIKALFTLAISIYSECYKITYIDNLDDKVS